MFQTTNQPFKESKHQMESSIGIFLARTRFVCRQHGDTALKKKSPTDAKDQCQKGFADAKDQLRQVKGTQDVLRKNPGSDLGFGRGHQG